MSVVTRWRRTFSSSVTHFTVTSGFLAVKSLVSPCMRIMSLLFTVAMVSVVWAIEGAEIDSMAAPNRAPNTGFTVSSQARVGHMPHRWAHVQTAPGSCQGSDGLLGARHSGGAIFPVIRQRRATGVACPPRYRMMGPAGVSRTHHALWNH